MFRGKESSNRIELSRLVQDLLNFGVLGSLRLWGWGGWVDGVVGGCLPHMCTCTWMHAHTHTHAHACVVNMIIPCKWLPPIGFGEIPGIPYDVICACACMRAHAYACVWGDPVTTPTPIHPPPPPIHPPPGWGTPGISQNSIALELMEIFQFCLKI